VLAWGQLAGHLVIEDIVQDHYDTWRSTVIPACRDIEAAALDVYETMGLRGLEPADPTVVAAVLVTTSVPEDQWDAYAAAIAIWCR